MVSQEWFSLNLGPTSSKQLRTTASDDFVSKEKTHMLTPKKDVGEAFEIVNEGHNDISTYALVGGSLISVPLK